MTKTIKLEGMGRIGAIARTPSLRGTEFPKHLQVAYGRHIFRLLHGNSDRPGLWLRDLPLSLDSLVREFGFIHAGNAYQAECNRAGVPMESRVL